MICIEFHQKLKKTFKKPKFWTSEVFNGFFKPKNLGFFEAIFQPWS